MFCKAGNPLGSTVLQAVALIFSLSTARAEFVGVLSLLNDPASPDGKTKILGEDFGFLDPDGVGWQAEAFNQTDGATIPRVFWPIIGNNWTFEYLKAAVIHDHYCDRRVRPWSQTHRMFYDALLESGVPPLKAGAMYYAVLVGGPKWGRLIPGVACEIGDDCVQDSSGQITVREADYDDPDIVADVEAFARDLEASPSELSPAAIEAEAALRNPTDVFLNAPSQP